MLVMNGKELRRAVKKLGTTAVSRASGVKVQTIDSWVNSPAANMRSDNHEKVLTAVRELLVDQGEKVPEDTPGTFMVGASQFIPVPVFDIRAAAGAGALVEDGEVSTYQVFEAGFLANLTRAPVRQLSVIQVTGDSMEPTMYGGDLILVDHSITTIDHGGLYILRLDDANIVKRCEKDYATKAVQIISDNGRYPIQSVKSSDRIQVIGRVIYIGRALR